MKTKYFLLAAFLTASCLVRSVAQNYDIYISDAGNFSSPPWQILKFDANGQNGQVFIAQHLAWPQDIFFLENENTVLVSNLNNGRISKFNASTGAFIAEFATGISGPTRMSLGPDSLLYVLQWQGNGKVRRYKLTGEYVGEFTKTGVPASIGLDWDAGGNLYVSSYSGKYVRKFGTDGADLGNFAATNLAGPTNIWFAENGDLMVMDYEGASIKRFDNQGAYKGVFVSGLTRGEGVDFLPNGHFVVGSGGTSSIREYDATGTFVKNLVAPGTLGLITPNAVILRLKPASSTQELYRDVTFVTPSIGAVFQVSNPEALQGVDTLEVYSSTGVLVRKINFAAGAGWDASNVPAGVYYLSAKLPNGAMGRQTVVVQR